MNRKPPEHLSHTPPSIYDGLDDDDDDGDHWFLPATEEAAHDVPWPTADRRDLLDPAYWQQKERDEVRSLADAAAAVARLDEVMAQMPELMARAALTTASDLSWATGLRITEDRLALYDLLHVTGAGDQASGFAAAHWAYRRLIGPAPAFTPDAMAEFLGRHLLAEPGLAERPVGEDFASQIMSLGAMTEVDLHPITRAEMSVRAWQVMELGTVLEGAVLAARLCSGRAVSFLPIHLALGGDWYKGITAAADRLRLRVIRVKEWSDGAKAATQDLSGRTPRTLIEALATQPALSADGAAKLTGASSAGVRRNMAIFEARNLAQEITGQGRFRVWRVRI